MKRVLLSLGLSVLCSVVASSMVFAGAQDQARFALEVNAPWVSSKAYPNQCADNPNAKGIDCLSYTVNWALGAANVWIVIGQAAPSGVTGGSFGIDYDGATGVGVDPQYVNFTYCGDGLSFPNAGANGDFPAQGGGIRVTWATCQNTDINGTGVHAVVGALYVYAYSPASLWLTPNNNLASGAELAVADCGGTTTDLLQVLAPYGDADGAVGKIGFGQSTGYTPCGVVPAKETTWGKLKNLYHSNN